MMACSKELVYLEANHPARKGSFVRDKRAASAGSGQEKSIITLDGAPQRHGRFFARTSRQVRVCL
jgi:hypothetical protein